MRLPKLDRDVTALFFVTFFVGAGFRSTIMPLYIKDVMNLDIAAIGLALTVSPLFILLQALRLRSCQTGMGGNFSFRLAYC